MINVLKLVAILLFPATAYLNAANGEEVFMNQAKGISSNSQGNGSKLFTQNLIGCVATALTTEYHDGSSDAHITHSSSNYDCFPNNQAEQVQQLAAAANLRPRRDIKHRELLVMLPADVDGELERPFDEHEGFPERLAQAANADQTTIFHYPITSDEDLTNILTHNFPNFPMPISIISYGVTITLPPQDAPRTVITRKQEFLFSGER